VGAGARAAGRDPASVDLVVFAFCLVDPDRARARAGVKPSVSWLAQRFPALAATAGQPLDAGTRAALARFAADYARYDLVHADEWARAVEAAAFLPDSLVDAFALAGAPADVAARVSDLAAAGVRHLVIRPPSRDAWRSTMRVFADGVIGGRSP
jgi:alkanesulfonate monooxygenase SsuD/methylene tetrahydromethanopterin reductase-like flavin-dependent oxidoreductase (luciferase family)